MLANASLQSTKPRLALFHVEASSASLIAQRLPLGWSIDTVDCGSITRTQEPLTYDGFVVGQTRAGGNVNETVEQLRASGTQAPLLVLFRPTSHPTDVKRQAKKLGALASAMPATPEIVDTFFHDVLDRCSVPQDLLEAYRIVVSKVAGRARLTTREIAVLELSVAGFDADGVAERLGITRKTYNAHVSNILRKTGEFRLHRLVIQILIEMSLTVVRLGKRAQSSSNWERNE